MKKIIRFVFNFQRKEEIFHTKNFNWKQNIAWFIGRHLLRNPAIIAMFAVTGYGSARVYNAFHPITVYADREIVKIVQASTTAPILVHIMQCESGGKQFAKDGQINIHVNADGTVDMGAMQINSVNFALATKLGYDLTKEADNIAFGKYLFENRGSEPWYSSKNCWNK